MNFVLLGDDVGVIAVAKAIVADPSCTLRQTVLAPTCHSELKPLFPALRASDNWEELLSAGAETAIIVSGSDERVLAAARQLAAAGKPLLILPAAGQSSAFLYELTLAQTETGGCLFPLLPFRNHTLVEKLKQLIDERTFGKVHHVHLERRLSVEGHASSPMQLLPAIRFKSALLCDADVLRFLGGDYNQVTASRSGNESQDFSFATVTLAGGGAPQAVWSATVNPAQSAWLLNVAGETGSAVLSGNPETGTLTLETQVSGQAKSIETLVDDAGPAILGQFLSAIKGDAGLPGIVDLTRIYELTEGVDRSVARRRTIDLYFDTPSERSLFKTQMTAAGCSLLVLTLVAVIFYLIAAAAFNLNDTIKRIAVGLIFLPLGLFLALQLLLLLTKPSTPDTDRSTSD